MEEKNKEQEQMQEQAPQNEGQAADEQQVENQEEQAQEEIVFSEDMLEDMTAEERENFFEEHGKGVMNRFFERDLTEKEENAMKTDLYELNLDLMAKTEEKAAVSKRLGDEIKSLQTQMNEVTNNISKGTKEVYEPCVKVLDLKNHKVYFFAQSDGHCVFQRNVTGEDLEQSFPFETVYNVKDEEEDEVELIVSRHGGFPEVGDDTSNEDGSYTMDEESVITVKDGKVTDVDRSASTKWEPQVGEKFKADGQFTLPTEFVITVEDGVITDVHKKGEETVEAPADEAPSDGGQPGDAEPAPAEEEAAAE